MQIEKLLEEQKNTKLEISKLLLANDIDYSFSLVDGSHTYPKPYQLINKIADWHKQSLKQFIDGLVVETKGFRFSTPVGEGKFTFLCCPDCREQQFICKNCFVSYLEGIRKQLQ